VQDYLHGLDSEWAALIAAVPSGSPGARASAYTDLLRILEAVLQLQAGVAAAVSASAAVRGLVPPEWQDAGAVSDVVGAAAAADRDEVWTAAYAHLHAVEEIFRGVGRQPQAAHPAVDAMLDAVLGRDVDLYSRARASIEALAARRGAVEERDLLLGRLRTAAPVVSAAVEVEGPDRDRRLATLDNAWNWARADAWLHRLADPNELRRLERELDDCRRRVEDTTRTLAAELAWAQTMARLTESERQHLVAWETAVRRIGKGTGKMAPVWRARAREAMEGCRPAVPAWIMPIFKVAETVGIVPEAFDVVIIDEASQSGPEAFFLQFLARKVIVVGDDQQISPSNIGIVREKVQVLNAQYMKDIPLGSFFVTDNSLFDIAAIRYRDRIMLREHFRCMPEIIQFSNDLCYQDQPLIPLRQFGADRLSPTIQVRHIRDGYRNGDVNEPEAEAVVQQVVSCIDDPAYAGKTFGVISLVGPGQAEFIRRRLALVVDPEEIERRQILCGEAYAFQGDERDVIFLSLVLAPTEGRRMGSLTKDADKRRFNVAASRARDQMWLFHTATLNDLHPDSVAHRLLNYCLHPGVERTPLRDVGLADLRRRIDEHERGEAAPRPFDSWFEADVFLHLADRGYRVIPQYPMADYSVDLVVEGLHGRLAVECDGDVWHGAEAFDRDAYRQRMLERCGMHFVRIRGSAYYRDPSVALEPLWAELRSRGIRPEAEDAVMVSAADRTEPEGAEATSPELGDEPETVVEEDGELKEANEVDELSAEPGDSPVSPRPSSWTGPYVVAHPASRRVPVDIHLSGADAETRRIIQEVIGIEAPVAVDLIVRRVRDAWGIGRAGNRVTEAVERQIDLLRNRGFIQIRDGFVYRVDGGPVKVRVPTEDPVTIREVEHVSPEELCGSMVQIVKEAGGFSRPDLVRATARLFGWRRVGPDISRILDDRIAELLGAAQLIELSGQISWAEGRRPPIVERSDGTPRGREHVVANRVAEMDGAALSRPGPEALQKPPQSSAPTTFPNDLERSMTERGWRGRRSEVNRIEARLAQAHKEGDHARIASLAAKLSDLRAQLEDVLVLPRPVGNGQAVLGCWVEFRDNGGPSESWLLVPPMEDDAAAGHLNVNTPFGRALYGHAAGDRVEVATRDGHHSIEVLSIVVD
jgi:transcription elongation GreA/GreB family factor/very-short-patch-repair endonuclease